MNKEIKKGKQIGTRFPRELFNNKTGSLLLLVLRARREFERMKILYIHRHDDGPRVQHTLFFEPASAALLSTLFVSISGLPSVAKQD
jgi:hypothetical protein